MIMASLARIRPFLAMIMKQEAGPGRGRLVSEEGAQP